MPRYTATIETSFGQIGPELIEAAGLQDAIDKARLLAEKLAKGALRHSLDAEGWNLRLRDEQGGIVGTVLLAGLGPNAPGHDRPRRTEPSSPIPQQPSGADKPD